MMNRTGTRRPRIAKPYHTRIPVKRQHVMPAQTVQLERRVPRKLLILMEAEFGKPFKVDGFPLPAPLPEN